MIIQMRKKRMIDETFDREFIKISSLYIIWEQHSMAYVPKRGIESSCVPVEISTRSRRNYVQIDSPQHSRLSSRTTCICVPYVSDCHLQVFFRGKNIYHYRNLNREAEFSTDSLLMRRHRVLYSFHPKNDFHHTAEREISYCTKN